MKLLSEVELYLFILYRPQHVGSAANSHCLADFIEHPCQFMLQNMLFMYYKVFLGHLGLVVWFQYNSSTWDKPLKDHPPDMRKLLDTFCLKVSWIIGSEFPEGRRESSSEILLKFQKYCPLNKIHCNSHIYLEIYHFIYQHNNPKTPNSSKIKGNVWQLPSLLWLSSSRKHCLAKLITSRIPSLHAFC